MPASERHLGRRMPPELQRVLDSVEQGLEARLRPAVERAPLQTLAQAAALGFVLGIVIPARLQMAVVAPAIRSGIRRLLARRPPGRTATA